MSEPFSYMTPSYSVRPLPLGLPPGVGKQESSNGKPSLGFHCLAELASGGLRGLTERPARAWEKQDETTPTPLLMGCYTFSGNIYSQVLTFTTARETAVAGL